MGQTTSHEGAGAGSKRRRGDEDSDESDTTTSGESDSIEEEEEDVAQASATWMRLTVSLSVQRGLDALAAQRREEARKAAGRKESAPTEIQARTLEGKVISLPARPWHTTEDVKEMIEEKEGIPTWAQRIIHAGRQLESIRLLAEYHIEEAATLHLVVNRRAGMLHRTSGREDFGHSFTAMLRLAPDYVVPLTLRRNMTLEELNDAVMDAVFLYRRLECTNAARLTADIQAFISEVCLTFRGEPIDVGEEGERDMHKRGTVDALGINQNVPHAERVLALRKIQA